MIEADNAQIEWELGILDQAELVLYQEGIMRPDFWSRDDSFNINNFNNFILIKICF